MINVVIVDDHELVRGGIRRILSDTKGIKVLREFSSGEEAVSYFRELRQEKSVGVVPNVVLMDIQMPGMGGIEATRRIVRLLPGLKVLVLTAMESDMLVKALIKAGARGFLTKDSGAEEMVGAVRKVFAGQTYIHPALAQKMAVESVSNEKKKTETELLSNRELQIMLMITQGKDAQEIAEELCLSPKTVNSYRYRIFEKLGVQNDVMMTHLAIRLGLVRNILSDDPGSPT